VGWAIACVLLMLGVGVLGARAIMGRVCTDAKATADQNAGSQPYFTGLPAILNIAHRGASKLAPEHSLRAYELALEQGADVLELDLRRTRDGELIVAHDRTLERTLGSKSAFSELSVAELEELAGARMPLLLDRVLTHFPTTRLNLELKDEDPAAARALAGALAAHGAANRVLVASTHAAVLAEFRKATSGAVATSAATAEALDYYFCYLMERTCPAAYSALQLPAFGWLGLTSAALIRHAHARGLMVHFWTIDEPERMRELIAIGADGIMTNRPDVLTSVLTETEDSPLPP